MLKRGQIYLANLNKTNSSIQSGLRPVIIVQNNKGNKFSTTVIVCPITSANKKYLETHCYIGKSGGLTKNSVILCEQITTISIYSLKKYIGAILNKTTLNNLNKCIRISLELQDNDKE